MLNQNLEKALNGQIKEEYYSSYLYLAMSAYAKSVNMEGMSHWLKIQAMEELIHAIKIFDFILERGGVVELGEIQKPPREWKSSESLFAEVLKHEQHITSCINDLVTLASKENEHATYNFLQWFVSEQVEEESTADAILGKLKLVGDNGYGKLMIDGELGARILAIQNPFTDAGQVQ